MFELPEVYCIFVAYASVVSSLHFVFFFIAFSSKSSKTGIRKCVFVKYFLWQEDKKVIFYPFLASIIHARGILIPPALNLGERRNKCFVLKVHLKIKLLFTDIHVLFSKTQHTYDIYKNRFWQVLIILLI